MVPNCRPGIPSSSSGVPSVQRHGAQQGSRRPQPRPPHADSRRLPPAPGREGGTALSFGNAGAIRHFDLFYFCFYTSILAVPSWELGEKHIFLYHF